MTQSQIAPSLVLDAQAGDAAARDELIAEHLPLIYNIVGRALDGHPDVDDLVQDTMLRALRGLPTLREPARFRSWLIAIAYRQIQMHFRSQKSAPRLTLSFDVPDPVGDFAERTTAELVVAEQRRELIEATHWLDDGDRRLLGLWWQEAAGELSRPELAAALEVQPKHAAVRVQRMKAQLDAARSVVRALRSRPRCPSLQEQVRRWNGVADPLWRKRLVRHVRNCPQCVLARHGLVAPEELLLGVAALPVPLAVAAAVLSPPAAAALSASAAGALGALSGPAAGAVSGSAAGAVSGSAAGAASGSAAGALSGSGTGALSGPGAASGWLGFKAKIAAVTATAAAVAGGGFVYAVYETPSTAPPPVAVAPPSGAVRPLAPGAAVRSRTPNASSTTASPSALPVAGLGVQRADVFVAPNGSDSGDGSLARPYVSIQKAVSTARTGQTIALRGGTYRLSSGLTISSKATGVTLSNYRDERPVIDASSLPDTEWAVTQQTVSWTVQGLSVINSAGHAYVCSSCRSTVFRHLLMRNNARSGLLLRDPGTTGNQVLDSDFTDGNGIGLGFMFGDGTGNRVRGNRFAHNAQSGLDLNFADPVTVEYNWSYDNGGNGFVLTGGAPHTLRHNAAWTNGNHGFTDDAGQVTGLTLTNNTAYGNGGSGFALPGGPATLRTNAAVDNRIEPAGLAEGSSETRNSWQEDDWSAASFRSVDPTTAEAPRPPSGTLPKTIFLTTGNGVGASMGG
ncbi:sigma-70 family RNA polymerase sigma factor [Paractinoplanes atraurantiacus]|uniref:RNA polymerase sigma factor n=1 Tax=Paractinoplanes atraurantiacus TaxID=1036182 RepID=A0A285H2Q8_9ACTN|nr:sigma-70 family RNA polymerase sigma factor [Actinoplanes atraurantiacus]SNY29854.1 RNA polymerase sigma factor, sigma-70 family [Actinoplanes atraurantiacus]